MEAVPTDQLSPSSPLSFAYLLAEVWHCLHPSEEMPRYQVFRVPLEGSVFEYRADVFMEASLTLGRQTYSFRGGHAATTDRAIQLAALAGLTSLRHKESTMQLDALAGLTSLRSIESAASPFGFRRFVDRS